MMNFKNLPVFLLACLILSTLSACGIKNTASSVTAQIMQEAVPTIEEEEDVAYANQASLNTLKTLEGLQRVNPNDPTILLMLARSFGAYTFAFVENDILEAKGVSEAFEKAATDRAKRFYGRGKKFGLQLLSKNKAFHKALEGSLDNYKKALKTFHKKDVPALFWTAFSWGGLANFSKDSPESIAEVPRIEALMNRVKELDEDYYYGGPHLFLGALYSARPKMLGGQPEESKKEFEAAIQETNGKFLMAKVLYAQYYAVQNQDRGLFETTLKEVLVADPAALPEQRLGNELAKRRAEILLRKEKLFF